MKNLLFALALLVGVAGCNSAQETVYSSVNFKLVRMADGVYGGIHKIGGKAICNIGVIDNGKETLIFDSFLSPAVAEELLEAVEALDLSPITILINSHGHNDHIRGNQVFPPDVRIISTAKTAELISEWEPDNISYEKEHAPTRKAYYDSLYHSFSGDTTSREFVDILMWRPYYETLAESHLEVETRLPDYFVEEQEEFNGPNRRVQIIEKGAGHTESDLILYLPDDKILFSGDLVFNECHPYVPHGSIAGWKNWLDFLNSLDVEIVVPGHGEIASRESISHMKDYLESLETLAADMHAKGLSMEAVETIDIPEQYATWWFDRFFVYNLSFAFQSN